MDTPTQGRFPVLPVRDTVIFPRVAIPLRIGRPASRAAVARALERGEQWILAVAQKPESHGGDADAKGADLYRVGTLCKIDKVKGNEAEGYQLLVRGVARFKMLELEEIVEGDRRWFEADAEPWLDVTDADESTGDALIASLKRLVGEILDLVPADTRGLKELLESIHEPSFLMDLCAAHLEIASEKKQELLETVSLKGRALMLLGELQKQKEALEVQGEIRDKLSHKMGKLQREALLREQLKTIREELGEEGEQKDQDDFRVKIEQAGMPEGARKVALDELKRLEAIGTSSPESHVVRNYLDLLCALPWSKPGKDQSFAELDLAAARATLDADHFGLDRIKKRIIQQLAVMKLKKSSRGSILLFVGPPGVGKTSLGESIARAMGRKFVRGSLGGVRDDAEIRGHRRTYVGAMPGRIIQAIKRAESNNPVFLLDEIDKMGRGFQGDPASALLEVLDPEQNATFLDHYLDVPFDLSKVFFIATANSLESIPGPLLDRMEVIELSGYTTAEKLHIARNHLVPKQYKEFGLERSQLEFGEEALKRLITHYTREAGVRGLQRQIASICRAATERVVAAQNAPEATLPVHVDAALIEDTLGGERFNHEEAASANPPGVVTGLAWTPMGGEILFVEGGLMPGQGKLTLTGQLGDVMKESAHIALSLVRSKLPSMMAFDYDKRDLHIHVPAGAIPKDGPSAGVTMLTTIASLFSGKAVSPKLAMTGEITLRGAVTPVGGIKEKLIGAHRAGIERVILPKRNERDLKDVPEEVRSQLKIEFAETAADVLRLALGLDTEALEKIAS
jgi:ATP-dependent Lon protease